MQAGHKYGVHFVLYEGPPDHYHSRYCVHVMGCASSGGGGDSWGHIKTMTRLMPVSVVNSRQGRVTLDGSVLVGKENQQRTRDVRGYDGHLLKKPTVVIFPDNRGYSLTTLPAPASDLGS